MAVINSPIDMNAMAASVYNTVMQLYTHKLFK